MARTLVRAETQINNDWSQGDNFFLRTDGSAAFEADFDAAGFTIENLAAPAGESDAATKAYVDSVAQGLDVKGAARVATTEDIADLEDLGGQPTIDGVLLDEGDRVLVKDQSDKTENGIYVVVDDGGTWRLERSEDANTSEEIVAGMFLFVEDGAVHADEGWVLVSTGDLTLDTSDLEFSRFATVQNIQAGDGLVKDLTTRTISAVAEDGSLEMLSGSMRVRLHHGLELDTDGIQVEADGDSINVGAGGISVNLGDGLELDGSVKVLAADASLDVDGSGVKVAFDTAADQFELGSDGIRLKRASAGEILIGQAGDDVAYMAVGGDAQLGANGQLDIQFEDGTIESPRGLGIQLKRGDQGEILIGQGTNAPADYKALGGDIASMDEDGDVSLQDYIARTDLLQIDFFQAGSDPATQNAFDLSLDAVQMGTQPSAPDAVMVYVNGILKTNDALVGAGQGDYAVSLPSGGQAPARITLEDDLFEGDLVQVIYTTKVTAF